MLRFSRQKLYKENYIFDYYNGEGKIYENVYALYSCSYPKSHKIFKIYKSKKIFLLY